MWRASGGEWLTDRALGTPVGVVRRVVGLVQALDGLGAGLDALSTAQGVGLLAERAAAMGLPPSGRVSAGGATRLLRCADGWLALTLARDEDRALLPAWLEDDVPADPDDPDRVWAVVADQVGERAVTGLRDRGTLLGLPAAVVGEMRDVEPVRVERVGEASPRPLDGAVVVNLASLWAGPLCADVLARLGARVIKVESTGRPDGGRRARRFFEALHGGCDSVALDLGSGGGPQRSRTAAASRRRGDRGVAAAGARTDGNRRIRDDRGRPAGLALGHRPRPVGHRGEPRRVRRRCGGRRWSGRLERRRAALRRRRRGRPVDRPDVDAGGVGTARARWSVDRRRRAGRASLDRSRANGRRRRVPATPSVRPCGPIRVRRCRSDATPIVCSGS